MPCPSGTFQSMTGIPSSAGCIQCVSGSFQASLEGASICSLCSAGTYSSAYGASSSSVCRQCMAGTYSTGKGNSAPCLSCSEGTYLTVSGATSRFQCVLCFPGTYQTGLGMSSLKDCQLCRPGTFLPFSGAISSSSCKECLRGRYQTAWGAPGPSSCILCPAGTYQPGTGASQLSDCVRCAAGKYQSGLGVTWPDSCVDCDPGTYQPVEGAPSSLACALCPRGTYQPEYGANHMLNCSKCNPGTYQPYLGAVRRDQCLLCTPGTIGAGWGGTSVDACVQCQAGSYSSGVGATDWGACVQCEAGYVQIGVSRSSASDCRPCIPGTYQPVKGVAGVGSCLACPEGTYQTGQGMTSSLQCVACPQGSYQPRRGMVFEGSCLGCPSGTYQTETGATSLMQCLLCGKGTYQSSMGSTYCTLCMAGGFQTGLGMIASRQCTLCPEGSFQTGVGQGDSAACTKCGVGTYQSLQGQILAAACISCTAGTYQPFLGVTSSTGCRLCWEGSYLTSTGAANSSDCSSCGVGLFSTGQGASSSSACQRCVSGTYGSKAGIAQCSLCNAGKYQKDEGRTSCISCPLGTYQPLFGVKFDSWCLPCPSGKYQSSMGASALADCKLCTKGKFTSIWGQAVCSDCSPGMYQGLEGNVVCFSCMSGSFSNTPGAIACLPCVPGGYMNTTGGSACTRCDPGTYQHLRGASHCFGCRRGEYQPNSSSVKCVPCGKGTFQAKDNASTCLFCESGLYASQSAAVSCTPCLVGQYQPSPQSTSCVVCPPGTIQPAKGQDRCVACPMGLYQSMAGRTICVLCAAGQYQTGLSNVACSKCKEGTYNSKTGQTSPDDCLNCSRGFFSVSKGTVWCTSCPSGLFASAVGQSGCSSCQPGYFQTSPGRDSCTSCEKGKFCTGSGMTRSDNCVKCSPGFYANSTGASFCTPCAPGTFQSAPGTTSCSLCRAGSYMSSSGWAGASCVLCNSGTFSSGMGSANESACTLCSDGYYSQWKGQTSAQTCELCKAGFVSTPLKTQCLPCGSGTVCPPGYHQPIQCVPHLACNGTFLLALPGFLPFFQNNCTAAIPCPLGTQCAGFNSTSSLDKGLVSADYNKTHFVIYENGPETTQSSCMGLPLSYGFKRVDPPVLIQEPLTLFRLLPFRCPAGYYLLGSVCTSCPPGTYSAAVGALDSTTCISCMPGFYSLGAGTVVCSPANPGGFVSLGGSHSPQDCPSGSYQTGYQATTCVLCHPGSYAASLGMSSCVECPAGTSQMRSGSTACDQCANTHFSSPGDAQCSPCGIAPTKLDPGHECSTPRLPSNLSSIWLTVQGDTNDDCVSTGATSLLADSGTPSTDTLSIPVLPLYWDSRCVHTLRFMGRPELTRTWTIPHLQLLRPVRLNVVPYNETVYPEICASQGFGVVFTVQDVVGSMRTDLSGASAVIRIFDSTGMSLLFWMPCDRLPVDMNEKIPLGTCHTTFCPTMAVLIKVYLTWDGGSVEGSAPVAPGPTPYCPPSGDWVAEVAVVSPSIPYFPGQHIQIRVSSTNSPGIVAVFKFALKFLPGVSFVSFNSVYSTIHQLGDGMLSVMGNSETNQGMSGTVLGELTLQLDASYSGVMLIVQVVPDSFQFTLASAVPYNMPVYSPGFSCRTDGYVDLLTDFRRFTTLLVAPRRVNLINWKPLQDSALVFPTGIDVVGVINVIRMHSLVTSAQCTSLSPQHLTVRSCDNIFPTNTSAGTGKATVLVQLQGVYATANLSVVAAVQPTVTTVTSSTGLSGRFKVFSRFQVGNGAIIPGGEVDATPFLGPMPKSGVVSIQNEQWNCSRSGNLAFTVGRPVLFTGTCAPSARPIQPASVFLYTGGKPGAMGVFVFSPSLLSVNTSKGFVLFFGSGAWSGQHIALGKEDSMVLASSSASSISIDSRVQTLELVNNGVSARCSLISLISSQLLPFSKPIPVFPPAPMSLQVSLSSLTLVTQQDLSGLIPSVTFVTGVLVAFTDGSTRNVLSDPRLQLLSLDEMMDFNGLAAMSRTSAGAAQITVRLAGMDCISSTVIVNILPSSVQNATLICPTCPQRLTLRDDPLSQQSPSEYPSTIPVTAFMVRRFLVDGTVLDRHENITVGPGGGIVGGVLFGLHAGALAVHTAFTPAPLVIHVFDRLAVSWSLLCNSQPCLNNMRLAPFGDGAGGAPFAYATALTLTLELVLADETVHSLAWAGGVECLVNNTRKTPTAAGCSAPLAYGTLLVNAVFSSVWKLPRRGIPDQGHSIFVHRLHRLILTAPRVLYQLHCSLMWEEDTFTTTAVLTDGVSADVLGVYKPTPPLFIRDDRVGADWEGVGTLAVTFGGLGTVVQVQATRSSRYFSQVSIDFLPLQWATSHDHPLDLRPQLSPSLLLGPQTAVGIQNLTGRVLRWTSSAPQVVSFAPDLASMTLLSDYYQTLVITSQLLPCGSFPGAVSDKELTVNVVPSLPGEIDFGLEETGLPMPPSEVGDTIWIPFFIYAPTVLHSYILEIYISEAAFESLDCTCGALPNSQCGVVSRDGQTFCRSVGAFAASQLTGRLLLTEVKGKVLLNALATARVVLLQAVLADSVVSAREYNFVLKLGSPSALAPVITRRRVLLSSSMDVQTRAYGDTDGDGRFTSADVLFLEYYIVVSVFKTQQTICLPIAGAECQSVKSLSPWQLMQMKPVRNPNRPASRPDGSDVLFLLRVLAGKAFFLASLEVVAKPGFISFQFSLCDYTQDCSPPSAGAQVLIAAPGNRYIAFTSQSSYDVSSGTITVDCLRAEGGDFTVTTLPTTVTVDEALVGFRVVTQTLDQFGSQDVSISNNGRFTFTPVGPVDFFNIIASEDSLLEEIAVVDYLPTTICQVLCDDPGLFLDSSLGTPVWINETSFSVGYPHPNAPIFQGFWKVFQFSQATTLTPPVQNLFISNPAASSTGFVWVGGRFNMTVSPPAGIIMAVFRIQSNSPVVGVFGGGELYDNMLLVNTRISPTATVCFEASSVGAQETSVLMVDSFPDKPVSLSNPPTKVTQQVLDPFVARLEVRPQCLLVILWTKVGGIRDDPCVVLITPIWSPQTQQSSNMSYTCTTYPCVLQVLGQTVRPVIATAIPFQPGIVIQKPTISLGQRSQWRVVCILSSSGIQKETITQRALDAGMIKVQPANALLINPGSIAGAKIGSATISFAGVAVRINVTGSVNPPRSLRGFAFSSITFSLRPGSSPKEGQITANFQTGPLRAGHKAYLFLQALYSGGYALLLDPRPRADNITVVNATSDVVVSQVDGSITILPGAKGGTDRPLVTVRYRGVLLTITATVTAVQPVGIRACCNISVAGPSSPLFGLANYPSQFSVTDLAVLFTGQSNYTPIDLLDPRISLGFDPSFLDFSSSDKTWTVKSGALGGRETIIVVSYSHPVSLAALQTSLRVTLINSSGLEVKPQELMLRRIHCSSNVFESFSKFQIFLKVWGGDQVLLPMQDLTLTSSVPTIVSVQASSVTGLRVGEAILTVQARGLEATCRVLVLDQSVPLKTLTIHSPASSVKGLVGATIPILVGGVLEGGTELMDIRFLGPVLSVRTGPLSLLGSTLVIRGNTPPFHPAMVQVDLLACPSLETNLTAVRPVHVQLTPAITARQPADVLLQLIQRGEEGYLSIQLITNGMVLGFYIQIQTDIQTQPILCVPGETPVVFADCTPDAPTRGGVIIAGAWGRPFLAPAGKGMELFLIQPIPSTVWGFVEVFTGMSVIRVPITAGQFGAPSPVNPVAELVPGMPLVDTSVLFRGYSEVFHWPSVSQSVRTALFNLLFLVYKQRNVDPRMYSNDFELSAMFQVTDRFLQADASQTQIMVSFHTDQLPVISGGQYLPAQKVLRVPATHVQDGWYVVEWRQRIPMLTLNVSFDVSTTYTDIVWPWEITTPLETGRVLPDCPRTATSTGTFLATYYLSGNVSQALIDYLACHIKVAARRIQVSGPTSDGKIALSVTLESLERVHQANQVIMSDLVADQLLPLNAYNTNITITAQDVSTGIERVGIAYINDTRDPPTPCPTGFYFSKNGSYVRLPVHASPGLDCYDITCAEGYIIFKELEADSKCIPNPVTMDIIWICVSLILLLIAFVSLLVLCVHCIRRKNSSADEIMFDQGSTPPNDSQQFFDPPPFSEEDLPTAHFQNIVTGMYLDDMSAMMIEGEFSPIPSCEKNGNVPNLFPC